MDSRDSKETWTPVSNTALKELWAVYRTDAALRGCRNALVANIFTGGITFTDRTGLTQVSF